MVKSLQQHSGMGQGESQWNPEVEQIQTEQTIKPVLRVRSILGKTAAENCFQTSCNIFQGVHSTKTVRPLFQNTSPSHHNKSHCAESNRHTRASKILHSSFRLWNTVNFKVNNQTNTTIGLPPFEILQLVILFQEQNTLYNALQESRD